MKYSAETRNEKHEDSSILQTVQARGGISPLHAAPSLAPRRHVAHRRIVGGELALGVPRRVVPPVEVPALRLARSAAPATRFPAVRPQAGRRRTRSADSGLVTIPTGQLHFSACTVPIGIHDSPHLPRYRKNESASPVKLERRFHFHTLARPSADWHRPRRANLPAPLVNKINGN